MLKNNQKPHGLSELIVDLFTGEQAELHTYHFDLTLLVTQHTQFATGLNLDSNQSEQDTKSPIVLVISTHELTERSELGRFPCLNG